MPDDSKPRSASAPESPKYDQDFFLALAAKGKDAWNAWRRHPPNKDVRVTFAGIDFREAPRDQINFEGFEFGNDADFSHCKWRSEVTTPFAPGRARFADAAFGIRANLTRATFGDQADFTGVAFGDWAAFGGAAFGDVTYFRGATFGAWTNFTGAAFGKGAYFTGVAFGTRADFTHAGFGDLANFTGATFDDSARFDAATFGDRSKFTAAAFGPGATFSHVHFKGAVDFVGKSGQQWTWESEGSFDSEATLVAMSGEARTALDRKHKESWKFYGSGPDRFLTISFACTRFDGAANFVGRSFYRVANFRRARFYCPPDFDTAEGLHRIDFTGAQISFVSRGRLFHWTSDSQIPIRLRALRKIAEEAKNHDLERDLYIEERKAERGVYLRQRWKELRSEGWKSWPRNVWRLATHCVWIFIMFLYSAFADYGRSLVQPMVWLIASGFFFYWRYNQVLAPLMPQAGTPDASKYDHAVRMLALGNGVPFVGPLTIDAKIKDFLFCLHDKECMPVPPEGYQLLVLSQNLVSIVLVFFIGLALRNYFKIK